MAATGDRHAHARVLVPSLRPPPPSPCMYVHVSVCFVGLQPWQRCQLKSRKWVIEKADGSTDTVNGAAVVGRFPTLLPSPDLTLAEVDAAPGGEVAVTEELRQTVSMEQAARDVRGVQWGGAVCMCVGEGGGGGGGRARAADMACVCGCVVVCARCQASAMAEMQRQEGEEPPAEMGTRDFDYVSCTIENDRAAMSGVFVFVPGRCDRAEGERGVGGGERRILQPADACARAVCGSRRALSLPWCARASSWTCRISSDEGDGRETGRIVAAGLQRVVPSRQEAIWAGGGGAGWGG